MAIKRRIILSAGHGGGDSGAVGQGTTEAAQTIDIVNRLAAKLKKDGQLAVVVVPHQLGLQAGVRWLNQRFKHIDDAVCIEVHKNSCGGCGASGYETWRGSSNGSKTLANKLHKTLANDMGMRDRGVKDHKSRYAIGFHWIRETNVWALLVECGFIGKDHLNNEKYANALYKGILRMWDLSPKKPPQPKPEPKPKPKPKPTQLYRVFANGRQVGAYAVQKNAWGKYQSINTKNKKIEDVHGNDVTKTFIKEFAKPIPHDLTKDVEHLKKRVSALEKVVQAIERFINGLKKAIN